MYISCRSNEKISMFNDVNIVNVSPSLLEKKDYILLKDAYLRIHHTGLPFGQFLKVILSYKNLRSCEDVRRAYQAYAQTESETFGRADHVTSEGFSEKPHKVHKFSSPPSWVAIGGKQKH
jgi:hypothetical protein